MEKEEYVSCEDCGEQMIGLKSYRTPTDRTKCEDCGGNTTKYNRKNPNVGKSFQKKIRRKK